MKPVFFLVLFCSFITHAQDEGRKKRNNADRFPSFFGIGGYAVFPNNFQDSKSITLTDSISTSTITQMVGRSLGAHLRRHYGERFGLETGIFYTQRSFLIDMSVPDSNIFSSTDIRFITFDVPLNGMLFLKMSEKIYANTGLGIGMTYKPSNVGVVSNPSGKHQFAHGGLIDQKFTFNVNGHIGFELRTYEDGILYLGGVARVPFSPLFRFQSKYQYGNNSVINFANFNAGWLGIELKYYFHNVKNKGSQPIVGPMGE